MNKYLKKYVKQYIKTILEEKQIVAGPSPIRLSSAYYEKERIMQMVQQNILKIAPQGGVNTQGDYLELLNRALDITNKEMQYEVGDDIDKMSDVQLTLAMIERTLQQVPYDIFFAAVTEK